MLDSIFGRNRPHVAGDECWNLPEKLFGDKVCTPREQISYLLGLISILSWSVAEIPQLVRNLIEGNAAALSGYFLLAWGVGDSLNLLGCVLADVLPTMFLTAALYTLTTFLLGAQWVYYQVLRPTRGRQIHAELDADCDERDHLRRRLLVDGDSDDNSTEGTTGSGTATSSRTDLEAAIPLDPLPTASGTARAPPGPASAGGSAVPGKAGGTSGAVAVPNRTAESAAQSIQSESARSRPVQIGGSVRRGGGGEEEDIAGSLWDRFTAGSMRTHHINPHASYRAGNALPRPSPPSSAAPGSPPTSTAAATRYHSLGGLLLLLPLLHLAGRLWSGGPPSSLSPALPPSDARPSASLPLPLIYQWIGSPVRFTVFGITSQQLGWAMGWAMTAIYASSRIPQIVHNAKRRSVKGLSFELFVFAVVGNATYLASILCRSAQWEFLQQKLPWIVDCVLCLALDVLIMGQFVYFTVADAEY